MIYTILLTILLFQQLVGLNTAKVAPPHVLAMHQMSLLDRYKIPSVNEIFKDNILLNIAYMSGTVSNASNVQWDKVTKPFETKIVLKPNEVFAFHDMVLPQFKNQVVKTTNAHFNSQEGFKSDGYLVGDGVCHLASLISWAAKDAKLDVLAPTNHDFMPIPDIPKQYGVAIYNAPNEAGVSEAQNLYIKNTFNKPIAFVFDYNDNTLKVSVTQL